jgi:hypothetical protein
LFSSSSAAKMLGESNRGAQNQSIAPMSTSSFDDLDRRRDHEDHGAEGCGSHRRWAPRMTCHQCRSSLIFDDLLHRSTLTAATPLDPVSPVLGARRVHGSILLKGVVQRCD